MTNMDQHNEDNFLPAEYNALQNEIFLDLPKPSQEKIKKLHDYEDAYPKYFDRKLLPEELRCALKYATDEEHTAIKTAMKNLMHLVERVLYKETTPYDYMIPDDINLNPDSDKKLVDIMDRNHIDAVRKLIILERKHLTLKEKVFLIASSFSPKDLKESLDKLASNNK